MANSARIKPRVFQRHYLVCPKPVRVRLQTPKFSHGVICLLAGVITVKAMNELMEQFPQLRVRLRSFTNVGKRLSANKKDNLMQFMEELEVKESRKIKTAKQKVKAQATLAMICKRMRSTDASNSGGNGMWATAMGAASITTPLSRSVDFQSQDSQVSSQEQDSQDEPATATTPFANAAALVWTKPRPQPIPEAAPTERSSAAATTAAAAGRAAGGAAAPGQLELQVDALTRQNTELRDEMLGIRRQVLFIVDERPLP